MRITEYELNKEQQQEIEKKLKDLYKSCQMYHVPMFAAVAISNDGEGTQYNNIIYNAKSHDVILKDDQIRKHMLVADGFEAVPPRDITMLDPMGVLGDG